MHYPYTTMNRLTSKRIEITDKEAAIELFTDYYNEITIPYNFYKACAAAFCPNSLYDHWVTDMINRYTYCAKFNTQPYGGAYDGLPAVWMDISNQIAYAEQSVTTCKCDIHGQ